MYICFLVEKNKKYKWK